MSSGRFKKVKVFKGVVKAVWFINCLAVVFSVGFIVFLTFEIVPICGVLGLDAVLGLYVIGVFEGRSKNLAADMGL
jgi:hypothetical protein